MIERPNILFIITDQLRADHLGCYGNRTIRIRATRKVTGMAKTFLDHARLVLPTAWA